MKNKKKTLAKLKIQQELSETIAEKTVYQEAFYEEEELLSQLPTSFVGIADSFLHIQEPCDCQLLSQSSVPVMQS